MDFDKSSKFICKHTNVTYELHNNKIIKMNKNFVDRSVGIYCSRHMKAIKETGNNLIAAYDPYDGIGIMDSYFPDYAFFTEFENDRFVDKWHECK